MATSSRKAVVGKDPVGSFPTTTGDTGWFRLRNEWIAAVISFGYVRFLYCFCWFLYVCVYLKQPRGMIKLVVGFTRSVLRTSTPFLLGSIQLALQWTKQCGRRQASKSALYNGYEMPHLHYREKHSVWSWTHQDCPHYLSLNLDS